MTSTFEKELEGKETWLLKGCIIDNCGIKSPIMKDTAILPREDVLSVKNKVKKEILDEIEKFDNYREFMDKRDVKKIIEERL